MPPMPPSGPVPSMPAPVPMQTGPAKLPMSADDLAAWQERLTLDREVRTRVMEWADANLEAYAPDLDDSPDEYGANLNTNRDFTLVERKKADLFYQRPEVQAIASPLMQGSE